MVWDLDLAHSLLGIQVAEQLHYSKHRHNPNEKGL